MRSILTATWIMGAAVLSAAALAAVTQPALAQTTPPVPPGVKPKPVVTVPVRPALQTPVDTANAMAQAERTAIQSDLAWVGDYNGLINGEASERMVAAIKAFQKVNRGKETGVLNPQERSLLADAARKRQGNVGWKIVTDMVTGARLGIPAKLVPQQSSDANGSKWSSSTGTIQILLARRKETDPSSAKLADLEKKDPAGRKVDYSVVKPDFFVVSGMQGLKKFYVRGQIRDSEVRVLTILYDQATEGKMDAAVIAMSSAFNPFPSGVQAMGPPPRKSVEYGTGIVVSDDGAIVTDRALLDGCMSVVIAGHGHADSVGEDKAHDLALLRIYGARDLKPLALGNGTAKPALDLVGIADPQNQAGAANVSSVKASATPVGATGDLALSPAPGLGFSGAAAIDSDGAFAGLVQLKPAVMAGPPGALPAAQAMLVQANVISDFLKAKAVRMASGAANDAKASVVRVICVRK